MSASELKILVIGRTGQVAHDLQALLPSLGTVICAGRPEIDLSRPDSIREVIRERRPDILINAAAYTAVDRGESEPELAMKINAEAPGAMAEEAKRLGTMLISYSTDYVFDGKKTTSYTEADEPNPLNVYGASKLAGDRAIQAAGGSYLIFRTSWVYNSTGKNFLNTIIRLATERDEIRVVNDQIGAPTWSRDIAGATAQVISQVVKAVSSGTGLKIADALSDRSGIYNLSAGGSVSWYGFAAAIVDEIGKQRSDSHGLARIVPITSGEYPTPAKRPSNSLLSGIKIHETFGISMPPWRESLARVVSERGSASR